jgi:hypothetical protein
MYSHPTKQLKKKKSDPLLNTPGLPTQGGVRKFKNRYTHLVVGHFPLLNTK